MKILFVHDNPEASLNLYVYTLIEGVKALDPTIVVKSSVADFWVSEDFFDIVHIMWPNSTLTANGHKYTAADLRRRIEQLKKRGIKIISTCHNLAPHYSSDKESVDSYDVVYNESAAIIHLGEYSLSLFQKKYPKALNVYIPHHVYDTVYRNIPQKEEAKANLGLSPKNRYILCFGMFRSDEERNLIIGLAQQFKGSNIKILAPAFSYVPKRRNILKLVKPFFRYMMYSLKYPNIIKHLGLVSNEQLPYYCRSCDVALIQRVKILNSGNLPLNFYFGNVVVGPNVGNVGDILTKTHNPIFDVDNIKDTLYPSVILGLKNEEEGLGERNRELSLKNFSTKEVCKSLLELYNKHLISMNMRKDQNLRGETVRKP